MAQRFGPGHKTLRGHLEVTPSAVLLTQQNAPASLGSGILVEDPAVHKHACVENRCPLRWIHAFFPADAQGQFLLKLEDPVFSTPH